MTEDRYTEVSRTSWFSRIRDAIAGMLFGVALFVVAFPVLFWNEGRAVKTFETLKEGGGAVVAASAERVDPGNAGKLIHVTARADTEATLVDPVFKVSAKALKLRRVVEMYQWKETVEKKTKDKLGGGTETVTTYSYSKAWSGSLINASSFKKSAEHPNPASMPYEAAELSAPEIQFGAFVLPPSLVAKLDHDEPLPLGSETQIPQALKETVKLNGAEFYIGADPASAQIGDTRVTFRVIPPMEVSVIAKQVGNTFAPYSAQAGGTLELLQPGVHTAAEMIQKAQADNTVLTWGLRLAGFVVMLVGLSLVLKPLSVAAGFVPILGDIVGAGVGFVAFLLSAMLSLITIGIAWLVCRPLLGGMLVAAALGLLVIIKGKLRAAQASAQRQ